MLNEARRSAEESADPLSIFRHEEVIPHHLLIQMSDRVFPFHLLWLVGKRHPQLELICVLLCILL